MPNLDKLLTVREVADLTGRHETTVKRDLRKQGDVAVYPNAARGAGANDPWLIPVSDLVAAGHYTADDGQDPKEVVRERRADRDLVRLQEQLAARDAYIARLESDLERERSQLAQQSAVLHQVALREVA